MIQRASDLSAIDRDTGMVNVIIEPSKHARAKLDYDPDSGYYKLHDVLPEGLEFPFNFGFTPPPWLKMRIRSTSLWTFDYGWEEWRGSGTRTGRAGHGSASGKQVASAIGAEPRVQPDGRLSRNRQSRFNGLRP